MSEPPLSRSQPITARIGKLRPPQAGTERQRHVVIEFDSYQTALDCFHSPEYQAAVKLRRAFSTAHFAIVEGV